MYEVHVKPFLSEVVEIVQVSSDNIDVLLASVKSLTDRYTIVKIVNMAAQPKPSSPNNVEFYSMKPFIKS